MAKVIFNVLAKDLENAVEISKFDPERILVGVMVKGFATNEMAASVAKSYMEAGVKTSIGLGAGDPAQWERVAEVSAMAKPDHINQVFSATGYTMGLMKATNPGGSYIVNTLLEPAEEPGRVYITTGEISQNKKESISCEAAAKLMADIGMKSVKFYPIEGAKKIEHVKAMAKAAVKEGITCFEPTGGISMENVKEIVTACIESGVELVIPHLYTSLVDKKTGNTKPEHLKELVSMKWE